MSEKRIVVPEGMLKAAIDAVWGERGVGYQSTRGEGDIKACVEAALRWLSEYPIVPTAAEALTLLQDRVASGHLSNKEYCAIPSTTIRCLIREWQRRMFLAPEPEISPVAKKVIQSFMGCTLTPEDADAIVEQVSYAAHGRIQKSSAK